MEPEDLDHIPGLSLTIYVNLGHFLSFSLPPLLSQLPESNYACIESFVGVHRLLGIP